jgi:hypothetical protein
VRSNFEALQCCRKLTLYLFGNSDDGSYIHPGDGIKRAAYGWEGVVFLAGSNPVAAAQNAGIL